MFQISVTETFLSAPINLISWIGDLYLSNEGGNRVLYAATRSGGGVAVIDIDSTMTLVDQVTFSANSQLPAAPTLDSVSIGSNRTLVLSGSNQTTLLTYRIEAPGTLAGAIKPTGGPTGVISAQEFVQIGAQTILYASTANSSAVRVYSMASNGEMTQIQALNLGVATQGVAIPELLGFTVGASRFLAAVSLQTDKVTLFSIGAMGRLTVVGEIGAGQGLGLADPTDMRVTTAHGVTYLLVASASSSSLSLLAVATDGTMEVRDHVIDTLDTRFQGITAFDVVAVGARSFIVVGGGDGGVNLMEILPDGRLVQTGQLLDTPATALDNISAITAQVVPGGIEVFVAGETIGISRLLIDLTTLGRTLSGSVGNDNLTGGAGDDMVTGGRGNDTLRGAEGRDVLHDGQGADHLFGGAGADLFVLDADGEIDAIRDYQRGIDRIDLSAWGRVYDPEALVIQPTSTGCVIRFGTEMLRVYSANGLPLQRIDFADAGFFDIWHAVSTIEIRDGVFISTDNAEFIQGTAGNDKFLASTGADTVEGSAGTDEVDFCDALDAIALDLHLGTGSAGWANAQLYRSIENISGTPFDDRIFGSTTGNVLSGMGGNDMLIGRAGSDTLDGGAGNDTLIGGTTGDWLRGGDGFDLAAYWNSTVAVRVDLLATSGNHGDAQGDRLIGIEAVSGSAFDDHLLGDQIGNRLSGSEGNDMLAGRGGNDTLDGGSGNDTLGGGAGADVLNGGAGYDMAYYWDATTGVRADLMSPSGGQGDAAGDRFLEIEALTGSNHADVLLGSAVGNALSGRDGDDMIYGRAGDDMLDGGAGNDSLSGGAGADRLIGGQGRDLVFYWDATAGVRADMLTTSATAGDGANDVFSSIEDLAGSYFDDVLLGSHFDNALTGLAGNDRLYGRGGNDTLDGGEGADSLNGGAGADRLVGGDGFDLVFYWNSLTAIRADLTISAGSTGDAAGDVFVGIEAIAGSQFSDRVFGDAAANRLLGMGGNDLLTGRAGKDTLYGGSGADTLVGGAGNDVLSGGEGADVFVFDGGRDVVLDLELGQDRLRLDPAAWGNAAYSVSDIVSAAVPDAANQRVILYFGPDDVLTLTGIGDAALLAGWIDIL